MGDIHSTQYTYMDKDVEQSASIEAMTLPQWYQEWGTVVTLGKRESKR